jgi:GNAT superfamily N-acetyltransferase
MTLKLEKHLIVEERRGELLASTDPSKLDIDAIYMFLSEESYWAKGISRERVERSIANSLVFGIYDGRHQRAFARVITDESTFAYLADVFVVSEARRRGLGSWLVTFVHAHPALQSLRRFMLATHDAHDLYARHGWRPLTHPERFMEVVN